MPETSVLGGKFFFFFQANGGRGGSGWQTGVPFEKLKKVKKKETPKKPVWLHLTTLKLPFVRRLSRKPPTVGNLTKFNRLLARSEETFRSFPVYWVTDEPSRRPSSRLSKLWCLLFYIEGKKKKKGGGGEKSRSSLATRMAGVWGKSGFTCPRGWSLPEVLPGRAEGGDGTWRGDLCPLDLGVGCFWGATDVWGGLQAPAHQSKRVKRKKKKN